MMTRKEAKAAALERAQRRWAGVPDIVIYDSVTIEKPYGWIFYYHSRSYLEKIDAHMYNLFGNGPVVVIAATGEVIELGTARPPDELIKELEKERNLLYRSRPMTHEEARAAALERIQRLCVGIPDVVIDDVRTVEKPYGWIFYYTTRQYLATGTGMLFGNAPIVVIAATGEVFELAYPSAESIKELDKERSLL
ncbi:MAG: YrhB family protein [Polyangiaceae bacterium]|nr:YrhB family protein [Polyangiaceae bacterium]